MDLDDDEIEVKSKDPGWAHCEPVGRGNKQDKMQLLWESHERWSNKSQKTFHGKEG